MRLNEKGNELDGARMRKERINGKGKWDWMKKEMNWMEREWEKKE